MLRILIVLLCFGIAGCATTAEDVGKGMQVGAASKFDNPIAPVIWVAGIVVEKVGGIKPEPVKITRELSDEEIEENRIQLDHMRQKNELDVKFRSGLTLKMSLQSYVADFCIRHPEINSCAKEYLEIANDHIALLAEIEAEKNDQLTDKR